MIKKLAKYGNSHALVLDKALLELLNITDTTKLKLSTDGKSLVITPIMATEAATLPISLAEGEAMWHYMGNSIADIATANKEVAKLSPEEWQNYRMDMQAIMEEFDKKHDYRRKCIVLMDNQTYKAETAELGQRAVNSDMPKEQYHKETMALMQKYLPNIPFDEMQKKYSALELKYKK